MQLEPAASFLHVPPSSALSHTLLPDAGGTVRDWPTLPGRRLPADLLNTVRDRLTARFSPRFREPN